jgi:hypothetical protein
VPGSTVASTPRAVTGRHALVKHVSLSRSYEADFPVETDTPAPVATSSIVVAVGFVPSQGPGLRLPSRHVREVRPRGHEGP